MFKRILTATFSFLVFSNVAFADSSLREIVSNLRRAIPELTDAQITTLVTDYLSLVVTEVREPSLVHTFDTGVTAHPVLQHWYQPGHEPLKEQDTEDQVNGTHIAGIVSSTGMATAQVTGSRAAFIQRVQQSHPELTAPQIARAIMVLEGR